eukprot:892697-Lingulodinium_polyedra.AAC.1
MSAYICPAWSSAATTAPSRGRTHDSTSPPSRSRFLCAVFSDSFATSCTKSSLTLSVASLPFLEGAP